MFCRNTWNESQKPYVVEQDLQINTCRVERDGEYSRIILYIRVDGLVDVEL